MRAMPFAFCCMSAAGILAARAESATIHVPADYPTIHQALDAAVSGDIVEVAPGTYDQFDTRPAWFGDPVSAVGFLKDGVTLRSSGGPAATTLRLDSNTARPAVLFGGGGEMHVEGFTISGSIPELTGVAIQTPDNETGSLNLQDCVIRDFGMGNGATSERGIDAYNADVDIRDSSIENIDSPEVFAVYCAGGDHLVEDSSFKNCSGGGIVVVYLSSFEEALTVKRTSFENNGWGISAQSRNLTTVEDSWFFQNTVGGILFAGNELIVRNNTFAENSGILAFGILGEFTGNTFYGGFQALRFYGNVVGNIVLERNVISFTTQGAAVEVLSSIVTQCNVFWQNAGGHTSGFALGATDLVSDPLFCDAPAQDFTVNAASPCLPWNNNGCGQIGAWGLGCGPVSVEPSSWGQIKALYR